MNKEAENKNGRLTVNKKYRTIKRTSVLIHMEKSFAAVEDFLNTMVAAQALPHTDLERYPTVKEKLERLREEERAADVQKQK